MFDLQKANDNVAKAIHDFQQKVQQEYGEGPEAQFQKQLVLNQTTSLINRLTVLSGFKPHVEEKPKVQFAPVTNFMGEEIKRKEPIREADLSPLEADKARFKEKVDKLYMDIDTIAPEAIVNSYTIYEDRMVVLKVAREVGLDVNAETPITEDLVEKILTAKKKKEVDDKLEQSIKEKLDGLESKPNKEGLEDDDFDSETIHFTITESDLEKYPFLKEAGYAEGNTLMAERIEDGDDFEYPYKVTEEDIAKGRFKASDIKAGDTIFINLDAFIAGKQPLSDLTNFEIAHADQLEGERFPPVVIPPTAPSRDGNHTPQSSAGTPVPGDSHDTPSAVPATEQKPGNVPAATPNQPVGKPAADDATSTAISKGETQGNKIKPPKVK